MTPRNLRAVAAALLVFCLVAAETFSVVHVLDDAAHTGHEPCKICVGAASFAAAATAAPQTCAIAVAPAAVLAAPAPQAVAARAVRLRPPSRAPPALS